ncbi:MAG: pantoate--beta-alanine ligase [Bacteroidales bacterium]|nr:pantoate--beta-alanine ligase [Bacteroidales bacterium]
MKIYHSINDLQQALLLLRSKGLQIGFVPTMGALHNGHLQLVERCSHENSISVVSIFVNPTQFNDKKDLVNYPRTLEADCQLLETVGCDIVFAPTESEMYPEPDSRVFQFGALEQVMEGAFRPGHFNGVAQIVSKLFDAVLPDRAYFGEKDFQQLAIIQEMTRQLNYQIEIVPCPIVREADGLAMSSRNARLTAEQRKNAVQISQALFKSRTFAADKSVKEVIEFVVTTINEVPDLRVEYFEIVDAQTLQSIEDWSETENPVGCIAVFCGEVRLIDNLSYASRI